MPQAWAPSKTESTKRALIRLFTPSNEHDVSPLEHRTGHRDLRAGRPGLFLEDSDIVVLVFLGAEYPTLL